MWHTPLRVREALQAAVEKMAAAKSPLDEQAHNVLYNLSGGWARRLLGASEQAPPLGLVPFSKPETVAAPPPRKGEAGRARSSGPGPWSSSALQRA
jgi:hypothetical protein